MSPIWNDDRNIPWGDAPSPIYPAMADFMVGMLSKLAREPHPFLINVTGRLIVNR